MAEPIQELSKSLNEVVRLLEKRDKNSAIRAEEMRRSLRSSRDAINLILTDKKLLDELPFSKTSNGTIIEEIALFEKQFLPFENAALNQNGVSHRAKKIQIRKIRNNRYYVSSQKNDLYAKSIKYFEDVRTMLDDFLNQLDIKDNQHNILESKKLVQTNWRKISYLVGGAALIAVNTTLSTTQPAITAVSIVFGKEMITNYFKLAHPSTSNGGKAQA